MHDTFRIESHNFVNNSIMILTSVIRCSTINTEGVDINDYFSKIK